MVPGSFLAILAAIAAVLFARRRRGDASVVDDNLIRAIEERGTVELDDPLDIEHIREEERRFLEEETWDEAEEW